MKNFLNIHLFYLLLLVGLLANCERSTLVIPESSEPNQDIELDMLIDGTPVMAIAGVGDFFNDTDVLVDQDDVYTFFGALTTVDCGIDCPNSFTMNIRNFRQGAVGFNVNQSISLKSYEFKYNAEPTSDAILLDLNINTQAEEPQFSWLINNNKVFTQAAANDLRVIDRGSETEVFATVSVFDQATGLRSFYTEELHVDNDVEPVSSRIIIEQIEDDSVALSVLHTISEDFEPLGVTQWLLEDFSGQNQQFITLDENEPLRLRIGEGKSINNSTNFLETLDGTRTSTGIQVRYDDNQGLIYNEVDFGYEILDRIDDGSALDLQTFEFTLVDENGVVFSSANGPQSLESLFEITNVEPFIENSKGQATVKIDCQFSCTVYAEDGSKREIQDAKATIAMAIP